MSATPRVTIGIATYNRDEYLAQAIDSCLSQDYDSLEVLVVVDGSTNPRVDAVLAGYAREPRLRVARHATNRGIAAAYNTFISEGRGELIAMLGDDDVALPDRVTRQVEVFDRHPDTGVVHGDATIIDADGEPIGLWPSRDFSRTQLIHSLFFSHNHLVDPTRMVRRTVYEEVGGYDDRYPLANDLDFWLRAAPVVRFRHCAGAALTAVRRHGANASDEASGRSAEIADVEAILERALERLSLRDLVPAIDWDLLDAEQAERAALLRLADGLERRLLPLPGLADRVRSRANAIPEQPRPGPRRSSPGKPRRLMITAFGWNDSGGGTTVPRLTAKELARRGWDVTVFHAAVPPTDSRIPYEIVESVEDHVRLIGVHNRPHGLFDLGNPRRELDDPPITAAFADALDRLRPDVVHFHNLHNLGAALIGEAAVRGLPSFFTTHNYWLICPRAYLLNERGSICPGPADGARCAACTGNQDEAGYRERLQAVRGRAESGLTRILAVSDAVRRALVGAGYQPEMIDVVRQAMPHEQTIWETVGRHRTGRRLGERLTVAFVGSASPHKGPQLLVEAAQRTKEPVRVRIIGEVPAQFAEELLSLDARGIVELHGSFSPSELPRLLAGVDAAVLPSMWWDCAPLVAAECMAARLPLLVPRLGGLPEVVTDGLDGLTFAGLDADDLARALDRLASEPGLLERLQNSIEPPRAFTDYVDELEAYYGGERARGSADRLVDLTPGPESGSEAPTAALAVRWQGDHGLTTSLAIVNDEVTSRLADQVVRVTRAGVDLDPPLPHPADVEVRHQWPPDFRPPPSGRLATIVPWEFGAVPAQWLSDIRGSVDALWVPSEFVRRMYVGGGIDPARVHVVPNGVDLSTFRPREHRPDASHGPVRFLYVGGITFRKGTDLLLRAWDEAFEGHKDVELVVKAAAAAGAYGETDETLRLRAASDAHPRVQLIEDDLDVQRLAELYRSCDVFVLPYRGEGFAMPVLEAMASGLPVIVTAGGPTDEFCPPGAGWRIRSVRREIPTEQLPGFEPESSPWVLEPDASHLVELLRTAASSDERAARGLTARAAAESYSWEAVSALYENRLHAISEAPMRRLARDGDTFPLSQDVGLRVLATPTWRDQDRLSDLLVEWAGASTEESDACLYLLADPALTGNAGELEAHVLSAAERASVDLERCADVDILLEPFRADRDRLLHAAMDVYVPLHGGCAGHARLARLAGSLVIDPGSGELARLLQAGRVAP